MFTKMTWVRTLLVAVLLALFTPVAEASGRATTSQDRPGVTARTKATEPEGADVVKQAAGSPELGWLILIGAVGFLVFVAWVFTRVGHGPRSDGVTD